MAEAISHYRIDNEAFLKSTQKAFEEAVKLAENEVLLDSYREQIEALVAFQEGLRVGVYGFGRVWDLYSL